MTGLHISDRQLWAEAVAGGESSFALLFERHVRAVYNHSFRLTGSWADAEDVTQQVFLAAWRRRSEVTLVADSALPWLLATATFAARGYHRSTRRWLAALRRLPPERSSGDDLAEEVVGRVDDERRMRRLLRAVNRLPRGEREALMLCLWSGVSYRDAATVLNIAEPSLRSRISRARARLARMLDTDAAPLTIEEEQA
ncbi:DNA-directed RNA polymerase sigma-70 factor [Virgisporangium aliadipatigenens]|uniref:DNA-directed RNA polymerase sigma-70 factor n=1 Tax=Virgisporangium aliadipatigenens TaxID=741659 RepID=A0A8J3YSA6_9ACTN|nr:RNA polymerase sigma factor [Virgisporangium aliadipatigenens]GIJ49567.1 DNA-directed RNA polymerase sigma-70 factor [Virgisporangium aliadipatigenens]